MLNTGHDVFVHVFVEILQWRCLLVIQLNTSSIILIITPLLLLIFESKFFKHWFVRVFSVWNLCSPVFLSWKFVRVEITREKESIAVIDVDRWPFWIGEEGKKEQFLLSIPPSNISVLLRPFKGKVPLDINLVLIEAEKWEEQGQWEFGQNLIKIRKLWTFKFVISQTLIGNPVTYLTGFPPILLSIPSPPPQTSQKLLLECLFIRHSCLQTSSQVK